MNGKLWVAASFLCALALSARAQSGIAFVTDVKGEAALDAGKATLMKPYPGMKTRSAILAFFGGKSK